MHRPALLGPTVLGRTVLAGLVVLLTACTGGGRSPFEPAEPAAAPAPPAACLLDAAALSAATGVTWTPNATTASDTRCTYDPSGGASTVFIGVDVTPLGANAPAEKIKSLPGVCDDGTLTPFKAGAGAFVCLFQGGSVFSAVVTNDRVVTVSTSAVPAGTNAEQLARAFAAELTRIAG